MRVETILMFDDGEIFNFLMSYQVYDMARKLKRAHLFQVICLTVTLLAAKSIAWYFLCLVWALFIKIF